MPKGVCCLRTRLPRQLMDESGWWPRDKPAALQVLKLAHHAPGNRMYGIMGMLDNRPKEVICTCAGSSDRYNDAYEVIRGHLLRKMTNKYVSFFLERSLVSMATSSGGHLLLLPRQQPPPRPALTCSLQSRAALSAQERRSRRRLPRNRRSSCQP